jgi:hypothetical protein
MCGDIQPSGKSFLLAALPGFDFGRSGPSISGTAWSGRVWHEVVIWEREVGGGIGVPSEDIHAGGCIGRAGRVTGWGREMAWRGKQGAAVRV